jgi:hypothetical protein
LWAQLQAPSSWGNSSNWVPVTAWHPSVKMSNPMQPRSSSLTAVEFAALARAIASTVHQSGLAAPGFRCPTRIIGVDRTIRRLAGQDVAGTVAGIVAVNVKDRPLAAVVADMIEGVVILNQLSAVEAARVRAALWLSLEYATTNAHVA